MKGRVVHCQYEHFDVFIGRPSKWSNPFIIGVDGNRKQVIEKYRQWITQTKVLLLWQLDELKGKTLGCWCKSPKHPNRPCHGDVLLELIEKYFPEEKQENADSR